MTEQDRATPEQDAGADKAGSDKPQPQAHGDLIDRNRPACRSDHIEETAARECRHENRASVKLILPGGKNTRL